jgi:hypothetical protein
MTLAEIELEVVRLQSRREEIGRALVCDGADAPALERELTNLERKLKRRWAKRALLRAQRNASGVMWLGDFSRG